MANLSRVIRLEVERKFAAFRTSPRDLRAGDPQFLSLKYLGQQILHDKYYDRQDLLSEHGLWLRQRNGEWQMKIRKGGDRLNSQFQETLDHQAIARAVQSLICKKTSALDNFGLVLLADITTTRKSWIADRDFRIVLDRTDFGHMVGEVELEVEVNIRGDNQAEAVMRETDSRIARFLDRYKWAFSDAPPIGKLSAYLAREKSGRNNSTETG